MIVVDKRHNDDAKRILDALARACADLGHKVARWHADSGKPMPDCDRAILWSSPHPKYEEALEYCHKALEYTTDKRQRARIYRSIAVIYQKYKQLDTALEYLNLGIAELGDDMGCPEMALIYVTLYRIARSQGDRNKSRG